jgi:5'-3' exonuclease
MTKQLVLIDGKNYCYRQHWVHRFLSSRGRCTSLLYGGLNSLAAMAKKMPDTAFAFVWDGEGKTWRHTVSKGEYKAHRSGGPVNEEMVPLFPQIPVFRKVLVDAGFRDFCYDGLECDDLIGMLVTSAIEKNLFEKVIVHSTDQDFYQLVTKRVGVMRGYKKEVDGYQVMYERDVAEEIELEPKDWVKVRALIGDPTDNIPHPLEGIGPKKAIKMVQAGLDPTVNWDKLKWSVRNEWSPVASRWKIIRSNYMLSHILRTPEHEHLDSDIKKKLVVLLAGLTKESFLRDRKKINDDSLAALTTFFVEYEMNELFEQRLHLWKML